MRIFLFVINGLGVGSLPDYSKYDDEFTCTLDNISAIEELHTLNKLGLLKCNLKESDELAISHFYRGRPLTIYTEFDYGLREIFGNCVFDKSIADKENLLTILNKNNVKMEFVSSRKQCTLACKTAQSDEQVFGYMQSFLEFKEGVFVGEFNDFAEFGLCGDVEKMNASIKQFDKFLGEFLDKTKYNDIVIITGNFGINPTKIGITREYNPIFVYSHILGGSKLLHTIQSNKCVAMTIVDLLNIYPNNLSLIDEKQKQKIVNYTNILKNEFIASGFEKVLNVKGKDKTKQPNIKLEEKVNKVKGKKPIIVKNKK